MNTKGKILIICVIVLICVMDSMASPLNSINSNKDVLKFNMMAETYTHEVAALKREVVSLQERVTVLETNLVNSGNGLTRMDRMEDTNNNKHALTKRAVRRRIRRPEVAFQASLTKESATFKLYDTIIFNSVITNIGRAYNKHTGIFTAPVSGTYTFNTNIVSEKGHYVEASIKVNDLVTVSAISDHRISRDGEYFTMWDQGNAVAILSLNRGDKVAVSVQWPQGSHVIHGVGKSSFSGYLVRSHEHR
ncbi:EMILIN-2-like isoform X2 [Mercenaria mercenaria]|uniref:EMILIN-2-like isoform X2 n=1 Tax=Mercenaria mercenaria TaxID=6596 RepID=UPI00234E3FA0|nr:EMILIN-2-like isoform X2 [Mercenaria mercenaria]